MNYFNFDDWAESTGDDLARDVELLCDEPVDSFDIGLPVEVLTNPARKLCRHLRRDIRHARHRPVTTSPTDGPLVPQLTRDTVVALGRPSDRELGGWYFERYVAHLPVAEEFVLFNRSWYNRSGVEHVMGYCTNA